MISTLNADSAYDRTVTVLDKTRDQEVQETFRTLIAAYTDEDARSFFDVVSEDRFEQDYITFSDAVYNDFRLYDIMQVDFWFEGIVPVNQVGRIVTVRWEERYESLESSEQFETRGLSRFTFDEIDGKFYLIRIEGNNLFGISSIEWSEEVPPVAGQEVETSDSGLLADVIPMNATCIYVSPDSELTFDIKNIGIGEASGIVDFTSTEQGSSNPVIGSVSVQLSRGESIHVVHTVTSGSCIQQGINELVLKPRFQESDTTNNSLEYGY